MTPEPGAGAGADEGRWFAHCLEFDYVCDGHDQKQAVLRLRSSLPDQILVSVEMDGQSIGDFLGDEATEGAPPTYWEAYDNCLAINEGRLLDLAPKSIVDGSADHEDSSGHDDSAGHQTRIDRRVAKQGQTPSRDYLIGIVEFMDGCVAPD